MEEIKSYYARITAVRRAFSIARSVGLSEPRVLTDEDIWNITDAADTSGIPGNDLDSFRLADLIIEGRNDEGRTCHVAVEISYTLAGNDTRRAIRNAQYLTNFARKSTSIRERHHGSGCDQETSQLSSYSPLPNTPLRARNLTA